jgi:excisionase family DNA binding protein
MKETRPTRQNATARTRQTGKTASRNQSKRDAKPGKKRHVAVVYKESLSAGEAANELGISVRTLQRLCSDEKLASFRTPGGQIRVSRTAVESYREGFGVQSPRRSGSAVMQNKREGIEALTLEMQERRARRELRRMEEEDTQSEQQRAAAAHAAEHNRQAYIDDARSRREEEARKLELQRERAQWENAWLEFGLRRVPQDTPQQLILDAQEAIRDVLGSLGPEQPQSVVQRLIVGAVENATWPWRRQCEIERIIQEARKELPFAVQTFGSWLPPSKVEARAISAARGAVANLSSGASLGEIREVAFSAVRQVGQQYEDEQMRLREVTAHQQRESQHESNKQFLISFGVGQALSYLKSLHSRGEIPDEDLEGTAELEQAVRDNLNHQITGTEAIEAVQRIARELVDEELG